MNDAGRLVGQVLGGRYRLTGILGQGGVGTVYDAIQEDLGRKVAVKVLHLELARDPAWARRMEREARATAALDHPNIVQLTDFQLTAGGLPFIVMERLSGTSLRAVIEKEGALAPARLVAIVTQVLAALEVAHRAGIVHRDIKPENIFLVTTPAAADFVKVLDFGIAKAIEIEGGGALSMTRTNTVLGTAGYMPPEQMRGEPIDGRADVYAVGACMYEALVGRAAITDARTTDGADRVITVPADRERVLRERRPDLSPALVATIARALAPDAAHRFSSAQAMIDALRTPSERATPSASELAPTDPLAAPLPAFATPRAMTPPPSPPMTPRTVPPPAPAPAPAPAQSSNALLGVALAVVAVLAICIVLLLGAGIWLVRSRVATNEPTPATSAETQGTQPPVVPSPSSTALTIAPPTPTTPNGPFSARRLPKVPPVHDAGALVIEKPDAAPPGPPREPWQNPPPLEWADATFKKVLETQATPATSSSVEAFVKRTVAPITRECFRTTGFQFQAGQTITAFVQFMIFNDGHIESFQVLADGGGGRASDCVDAKLRATSARGVCDLSAPPACTIWVDLKAKYR